ncbi:hypothetical protein JJV70_14550 [Streptomyces sp. JJ66]|uniref:hypothetical protein n=1 Tax=Streptomyces sp. JJ66 TaxID=2803843 RepID=UPI001C55C427|nr:hypothetical protein [Streptomyces sp. JJ66]MBW1603297.1 hypothetical protein [Streptomyces sp. JJ66]
MWPGQQPGGGQNPQEPNPYQQPGGFGQPNPYQQPGGGQPGYPQQPNPYQQPGGLSGQQPWGQPTGPGSPQLPPGGGRPKNTTRNTVLAIAVSLAVMAGAVVTGVWLLSDDGDGDPKGGGVPPATASADPSRSTAKTGEPEGDDQGSGPGDDEPRPVVDGWQVVVNSEHNSAFDVPAAWEPASETTIVGWGESEESEDALIPAPAVAMSAPAFLEENWCRDSEGGSYSRAVVGTKGAQGAKNTEEAALAAAQNFVYYRHGGENGEGKELVDWTESETFSNDHGIEGHIATATHTGGEKTDKCQADGKSVAISWLDGERNLRLWVLVSDTGVKEEVPQKVIDTMTASLRPYEDL